MEDSKNHVPEGTSGLHPLLQIPEDNEIMQMQRVMGVLQPPPHQRPSYICTNLTWGSKVIELVKSLNHLLGLMYTAPRVESKEPILLTHK